MAKVLLSVPAYNEHIKLQNALERFLKSSCVDKVDYLVVDDHSDDGTTDMVRSYSARGIRMIRHEQRRGVGAAIRSAIRHAQAHGYEVLVIMAGNDKDDPNQVLDVLGPILNDGYDLVLGSRYKGKVGVGGDMPLYRKFATRLHPLLMSFFTGTKITDSTNGFRAIRLSVLKDERIDLDQDWLDAYELEPYLLFKTIRLGYKFTEVFVTKIYPSKKLGYTKMAPITGWWSILRPVFYLGLGLKK